MNRSVFIPKWTSEKKKRWKEQNNVNIQAHYVQRFSAAETND